MAVNSGSPIQPIPFRPQPNYCQMYNPQIHRGHSIGFAQGNNLHLASGKGEEIVNRFPINCNMSQGTATHINPQPNVSETTSSNLPTSELTNEELLSSQLDASDVQRNQQSNKSPEGSGRKKQSDDGKNGKSEDCKTNENHDEDSQPVEDGNTQELKTDGPNQVEKNNATNGKSEESLTKLKKKVTNGEKNVAEKENENPVDLSVCQKNVIEKKKLFRIFN